jgi:integrase/recombinase XerD
MPAKLPDNCYLRGDTIWGRITIAGREYRSSLRTSDPREAKERVKAWITKLERQSLGMDAGHRFKDAVIRWNQEVLPESVKPSVARRYLTSIAALDEVFGPLKLSEITTKTVALYVSLRSGKVTNATIRRDLTALSRLLSACTAWGWMTENPARQFDRSVAKERKRQLHIPRQSEIDAVLVKAPANIVSILRLLLETGAREQEIVTLEWPEVDARRRQITLLKTKTSRPRALNWLTPGGDAGRVLDALEHGKSSSTLRPGRKRSATLLFPSAEGGAYTSFPSVYGNLMRRMAEEAKKEKREFRRFRVHDLRHRFAINWLKNGGDIYRLSRHLGHKSVKTTEIYLDYLTDDEIDTIRGVTAQKTAHHANVVADAILDKEEESVT